MTTTAKTILLLAGVIIIIAGLKASSEIITPFLLALFLSMITAGPLNWMIQVGVPERAATILSVLGLICILIGLGTIIGASLSDFAELADYYEERFKLLMQTLLGRLKEYHLNLPDGAISEVLDPRILLNYTASMLGRLSALLSNSFIILLLMIFMLLEISRFPEKLKFIMDDDGIGRFKEFQVTLNKYLLIKTGVSLLTGVTVWIGLSIIGVNFALIWGLLAFLLNYIPNVGSLIAAVPPVLLALIDLGLGSALAVAVFFLIIENLYGNFIEPRLLGRSLGLSTLIVFVSLIFWGWVFGPIGMLLSVPLTVVLKIGCEVREETRWLAIILGDHRQILALTRAKANTPPKDQPESQLS